MIPVNEWLLIEIIQLNQVEIPVSECSHLTVTSGFRVQITFLGQIEFFKNLIGFLLQSIKLNR